MELDGRSIKLQIWDTAGQERFHSITSNYYNGSHAIAIVYDITSRQSFENVRKWINDINDLASPTVVKLLVGNKTDLEEKRVVRREEGQMLADSLGIPFIETSAKSSDNVKEMFTQMCRAIAKRQETMKGPVDCKPAVFRPGKSVEINNGNNSGCC